MLPERLARIDYPKLLSIPCSPMISMVAKSLLPLCLAISLCSCGTIYETQVTIFHKLPPKGGGETFYLAAPSHDSGLETAQHMERMASGLIKHGWVPADRKSATYRVGMNYGILDGREVHGVAPIFGQTGGGTTTYHSGSTSAYSGYGGYARGTYSGTSYTPATYGVVGAVPTVQTVFDRYLFVLIFDSQGKRVLEAKCISTGTSSNLSDVVPRMIDSFLADFPGVSGKTRNHIKY